MNSCQAIQRNQIPTTEDGIIPDEVLIISCEEDQAVCAPLLRKGSGICIFSLHKNLNQTLVSNRKNAGGKVYSSELILSGVVTQGLEYDRLGPFVSLYSIISESPCPDIMCKNM